MTGFDPREYAREATDFVTMPESSLWPLAGLEETYLVAIIPRVPRPMAPGDMFHVEDAVGGRGRCLMLTEWVQETGRGRLVVARVVKAEDLDWRRPDDFPSEDNSALLPRVRDERRGP